MAWYRCVGNSSGGGSEIETILTNGVVSTDSAYATAYFDKNISGESGGILIRLRDNFNGINWVNYAYVPKENIPSDDNYIVVTISLHQNIQLRVYNDKIIGSSYSGAFCYIYADIVGFAKEIYT